MVCLKTGIVAKQEDLSGRLLCTQLKQWERCVVQIDPITKAKPGGESLSSFRTCFCI